MLIALFFVIGFPLSLVLDLILGKGHSTFFRRAGKVFEWVGECVSEQVSV